MPDIHRNTQRIICKRNGVKSRNYVVLATWVTINCIWCEINNVFYFSRAGDAKSFFEVALKSKSTIGASLIINGKFQGGRDGAGS